MMAAENSKKSSRINVIFDRELKEKLDILKNHLEKKVNISLSYRQVLSKLINEYVDKYIDSNIDSNSVAREEKDK